MARNFILMVSIVFGIGLSFLVKEIYMKYMTSQKRGEEWEAIAFGKSCILDSESLSLAQDSVVLYGDENSYDHLKYHYCQVPNNIDLAYYSLMMSSKHSLPRAYYDLFDVISSYYELDELNPNGFVCQFLKKNLIIGASLNDEQCCRTLENLYNKGILFKKNKTKSLNYKQKIDKMNEIIWYNE